MKFPRSLLALTLLVTTLAILAGGSYVMVEGRGSGDTPAAQPAPVGPVSDYQQSMLADGVVSDDEMSAAVEATVQCLVGRGLKATTLPGSSDGGVPRMIQVVTSGESPHLAVDDCRLQYSSEVDRAYARQQGAKSPKSFPELQTIFDDCMDAKGFPTRDASRPPYAYMTLERAQQVDAAPESQGAKWACLAVVQEAARPD